METLALIAPYAMVAGTGISAVSSIVQGGTQAEAARAQAEAYRSQGERRGSQTTGRSHSTGRNF